MKSRSDNLPVTLLFSNRNGISTARVLTEALSLFEVLRDGVTDEDTMERIAVCTEDLEAMLHAVR